MHNEVHVASKIDEFGGGFSGGALKEINICLPKTLSSDGISWPLH
jgi:hypothetical protein